MSASTGSRIPALGPRGEGWVALQTLLIAALIGACWWTGSSWPLPWQSIVALVGNALLIGGLLIIVVGSLGLSSSFTIMPRPPDDGQLVTTGLYRYVRNPIYAGVIASTVGASLGSASWLALLVSAVLAVVLDLKTRREEVFLRERFPEYAAYAARTRKFVPGLY